MISFLKSFLRKVLFKDQKLFPAVRISFNQIKEKVLLKQGRDSMDISEKHCIVCHRPFLMAVWMTPNELSQFSTEPAQVLVLTGTQVSAELAIRLKMKIEEGNNWVVIFLIEQAKCFQTNSFHQLLIRTYFRNKNTLLEDKIYGAMYSYPRKVIAASFRDKEHYNIFPMDFQCFVKESNLYILGLRTTNTTLAKILQARRLVISDTDSADINDIYFLGGHHSSALSSIDKLPFGISDSELFGFPVPDFAASYKEMEIVQNLELGSHMLLIAKALNSKEAKEPISYLYHIHFFEFLRSNYVGKN